MSGYWLPPAGQWFSLSASGHPAEYRRADRRQEIRTMFCQREGYLDILSGSSGRSRAIDYPINHKIRFRLELSTLLSLGMVLDL